MGPESVLQRSLHHWHRCHPLRPPFPLLRKHLRIQERTRRQQFHLAHNPLQCIRINHHQLCCPLCIIKAWMPLNLSDTSLLLLVCTHHEWLLSLLRMECFSHRPALFDRRMRWKAPLMRSLLRSANESPNCQGVNCTRKRIGFQCIP